MAGPLLFDRVKETSSIVGTGSATLLGAVTGFKSFSVIGDGNTTYYVIAHRTANEWEVGIGTYTVAGTILARTSVLASSNGGSAVSFSAGTKDVFVTAPAEILQYIASPPAGELGGTWASPTVDSIHSGSSHASILASSLSALTDHEAAADPHAQYLRQSEADVLYAPSTALASALAALAVHEADTTNIHGIVDTALLETITGAAAQITAHEVLADPHPTYLRQSEADALYATIAGAGDVFGPASAISGRVAVFNGTTGKLLSDSGTPNIGVASATSIALNPGSGTVRAFLNSPTAGGVAGQLFLGANLTDESTRISVSHPGIGVTYDNRNVANQVNYSYISASGDITYPFTLNLAGTTGPTMASTGALSWGSTVNAYSTRDLFLFRDGPGILAQRNTTNAQTFRIYGTFTDVSNYECASLSHVTGTGVLLAAETAGTGADNLSIELRPAGTGGVGIGISTTSHRLHVVANLTEANQKGIFTDVTAVPGSALTNYGSYTAITKAGGNTGGGTLIGQYIAATSSGSNQPLSLTALDTAIVNNSGGTVDTLLGFQTGAAVYGASSHTANLKHINLRDAYTNAGQGHISTQYGLYINDLTAADNNYAIYTGTGIVRFGGNVGIGTIAPTRQLTVAGLFTDISNYEYATLYATAGVGVTLAAETLGTGADNLNIELRPAGTGKVGIGTATPEQKLQVVGNLMIGDRIGGNLGNILFSDSDTFPSVQFRTDTTIRSQFLSDVSNGDFYIDGATITLRQVNSTVYVKILNNGNVGIGTTVPTRKLTIAGLFTDASNYEYATLYATAGVGVILAAETLGTGADNLHIELRPAGTGKVGIGTSTPDYALSVATNSIGGFASTGYGAGVYGNAYLRSSGGTVASPATIVSGAYVGAIGFGGRASNSWINEGYIVVQADTVTGDSHTSSMQFATIIASVQAERMRIAANGFLGIGTTAPATNLHVLSANRPFINSAGLRVDDTTAQAAGVGGSIGFGYKYTDAGVYVLGAGISATKRNATSGNYDTGLTFWVTANGQGSLQTRAMDIDQYGVVLFQNGTTAAPAIAAAAQPATGIKFRTGALDIIVSAGISADFQQNGVMLVSTSYFGWSAGSPEAVGSDVLLYREAAGILAQRNGTNAQAFRLYATYTDASNYEYLNHSFNGASYQIGAESAGSGSANRNLVLNSGRNDGSIYFNTAAVDRWRFNGVGHFITLNDNAYDIGASGATRPRTGYFGTSVVAPSINAGAGSKTAPSFTVGDADSGWFSRVVGWMMLSVNGNEVVQFDTGGAMNLGGGGSIGFASGYLDAVAPDTIFRRDAAGILAQRNGATAQVFRVYGTWTDASNYERASLSHVTGTGVLLAAETAGTGADNLNIELVPSGAGGTILRGAAGNFALHIKDIVGQTGSQLRVYNGSLGVGIMLQALTYDGSGTVYEPMIIDGEYLNLSTQGTGRWQISASMLNPIANNTYDIGDATHRVRNLWVGTSIVSPIAQLGANSAALQVGTHSALAAETVSGYITIKDSGGTDRKIAVVS